MSVQRETSCILQEKASEADCLQINPPALVYVRENENAEDYFQILLIAP